MFLRLLLLLLLQFLHLARCGEYGGQSGQRFRNRTQQNTTDTTLCFPLIFVCPLFRGGTNKMWSFRFKFLVILRFIRLVMHRPKHFALCVLFFFLFRTICRFSHLKLTSNTEFSLKFFILSFVPSFFYQFFPQFHTDSTFLHKTFDFPCTYQFNLIPVTSIHWTTQLNGTCYLIEVWSI